MQNSKPLLILAHRGEALTFIKRDNLLSLKTPFENLYMCKNYYLLIGGEGVQNTLTTLAAACGHLGPKISQLINLGIAGSLNKALKKGDIVSLRTLYYMQAGQLQFKSYTSSDSHGKIDGITSSERLLSPHQMPKLQTYGDIVDRECWGLGPVANFFKLGFLSFKYISDIVSENSQELCQRIKQDAPIFSDKLYHFYYQQNISLHREHQTNPGDNNTAIKISGYYFTTTQKRQLVGLLKALSIKNQNFSLSQNIDLEQIKAVEANPKQRSNLLIKELKMQLNPFKKALIHDAEATLAPLKMAHFSTKYDPQFESNALALGARIQNQKQIDNLIRGLKRFSFEEYNKLFAGKIDV